MKKQLNKVAIIILLFSISVVVMILIKNSILVLDNSVKVVGNTVEWNNKKYVPCTGVYSEGKTIAKTSDGKWNLNEVEEDPTHTFVVVRSFIDQELFVAYDYDIPSDGKITSVYWDGQRIIDADFCNAVSEIYNSEVEIFEYETEGIYMLTDTQHMRTVYFGYNNCPIGTEFQGYMGKINGKWALTLKNNYIGESKAESTYSMDCCYIDERYAPQLEKYFR